MYILEGEFGRSGLPELLHFFLLYAGGEVSLHSVNRQKRLDDINLSLILLNMRKASSCFTKLALILNVLNLKNDLFFHDEHLVEHIQIKKKSIFKILK